jgi:ATP-binding cassette subfamily C protein
MTLCAMPAMSDGSPSPWRCSEGRTSSSSGWDWRRGLRGIGHEEIQLFASFVRQSGPGPAALFDLPWLPFYLAICFAFHPLIGVTALGGAFVLVILTLLTDRLSRQSVLIASSYAAARNRLADGSRRNAEVLMSMALSANLLDRWRKLGSAYRNQQQIANDLSGGFNTTGRALRMMLQSTVLGVGAYLVIHQEATGGIIIASSILTGRALAPVDLAIGNWKSFISARQSWQRLGKASSLLPAPANQLPLPAPFQSFA